MDIIFNENNNTTTNRNKINFLKVGPSESTETFFNDNRSKMSKKINCSHLWMKPTCSHLQLKCVEENEWLFHSEMRHNEVQQILLSPK